MQKPNRGAPRAYASHPVDPDRLFARPIVEGGRLTSLGADGRACLERMGQQGRAAFAEGLAADLKSSSLETRGGASIMLEALSELEAWEAVESARRMAGG